MLYCKQEPENECKEERSKQTVTTEKRFVCLLAALLALALLAGCARPENASPEATAAPVVPEGLVGADAFAAQSLPQIFADLNGENRVYSPLNLYLALAMLAELTEGESREQLLSLLGEDAIESLRAEAQALYDSCSRDDEQITSLPAASVWLNEEFEVKPGALDRLTEDGAAELFSVPMGTESTDQALRGWVNERTKHLLEAQAGNLRLDRETSLALVTTLYFKAGWMEKFEEEKTEMQPFHADSGDRDAAFMHDKLETYYYRGKHFGAIRLRMRGGAAMWLLLPDEDSSLQAMINEGEASALLASDTDWRQAKEYWVNLSLPKFDLAFELSLSGALRALGLTDVFDPSASDFSPLSDDPLYVSQVQHAARVKIDEEGVEAVAYTDIPLPGDAWMVIEPKELDFVCDRPFLFAVTLGDTVLFLGAVNDPGTGE